MRTARLGRRFDAVFVHDAICYMTSAEELKQALATVFIHTRPGAVAVFAPDHMAETFRAQTQHGGHDGEGRSLRYLEWTWDPDPADTTYVSLMVYALREGTDEVRCVSDRHVGGLFSRETWDRLLSEVGFTGRYIAGEHSELPPGEFGVWLGRKPV